MIQRPLITVWKKFSPAKAPPVDLDQILLPIQLSVQR
jgi:hypothetical protein